MPVQVPTIGDEILYILQYWIQNNNNAITGTIGQNVVWNLAKFIQQNPENYDKATVVTAANINYTTQSSECILIFTNNSAGSVDFGTNIWNKWYFVNATNNVRAIAGGKFYYDINGVAKTSIGARKTVYIAQGDDGFWYEVVSASGGGTLTGTSNISITSSDFESDGVTYLNSLLVDDNVSVFWSDLPNFIYKDKGQWEYVVGSPSNGIKILIPGFDANTFDYNLELFLKVINL